MREEMLHISHLSAGYGNKKILKNVNFSLREGEFVGLIGSNGTGKTTLIKCISGLLPVREGEISLCGRQHSQLKSRERAQLVAVVPQSYHVDYDFTVEDIVMMGRNPYLGLGKRESQADYDIVREAMEATNTEQFRGRFYNELSGGERQRVILARAIAQQTRVILLDEPTSALDIHHQIEVMELIERLNREEHVTILAVLHDINMAARFCRRIVMLQEGLVVADGSPAEVVNHENMEALYDMKLMVRENPLFHKPEIIPIRVMSEKQTSQPLHVHVIGGAGGAVRIIEELDARGYRVTAGVLNRDSADWEICQSLHLEGVEIPPFTAVKKEDQDRNLRLMEEAQVILIADVPFGTANLQNLRGLENLKGRIFFHKNALSSDFTQGGLVERLREIQEKKKITYFGDHDEFLAILEKLEKM